MLSTTPFRFRRFLKRCSRDDIKDIEIQIRKKEFCFFGYFQPLVQVNGYRFSGRDFGYDTELFHSASGVSRFRAEYRALKQAVEIGNYAREQGVNVTITGRDIEKVTLLVDVLEEVLQQKGDEFLAELSRTSQV